MYRLVNRAANSPTMAAEGVQATAGLVSRDSDREDYGAGNKRA